MTDYTERTPIHPEPTAHVAVCPACEVPTLVGNLAQRTAAMHCPACGSPLRPADVATYELVEAGDE